MRPPTFLELPRRQSKPRTRGLTHVLDKGLSLAATRDHLDTTAALIDIVKIGWGIGYVDPRLQDRVTTYREAGVPVSLGGTLLEIAAAQGRVEELRDWALASGITTVEVSNGLGALDAHRKQELIRTLSKDFIVAAEVGSKDAATPVIAAEWLAEMESDLEAGARWVIAEGRESGTVGIYQGDGAVRDALIDTLTSRIPVDRIIFEAPHKAQQAWFVRTIGPEVNLGNIPPEEVLPLETLRLGLRADTAAVTRLATLT
ncbi:MAG: phosphosulfolactate synthase [Candidatus Nanopelagicales bacterium]|nr:phosphosulfolactate synthase [Candidatus Nanopelagicales bacterium]